MSLLKFIQQPAFSIITIVLMQCMFLLAVAEAPAFTLAALSLIIIISAYRDATNYTSRSHADSE